MRRSVLADSSDPSIYGESLGSDIHPGYFIALHTASHWVKISCVQYVHANNETGTGTNCIQKCITQNVNTFFMCLLYLILHN